MRKWQWALVVGGLLAGCGSGSSGAAPSPPPSSPGTDGGGGGQAVITISAYAYSPTHLIVNPGDTVTVMNGDSAPHSVTSEASAGNYTRGSVNGVSFDTGAFTGTRSFTIPSTAPHGTVVPYYCTVHGAMMANTAQITIR